MAHINLRSAFAKQRQEELLSSSVCEQDPKGGDNQETPPTGTPIIRRRLTKVKILHYLNIYKAEHAQLHEAYKCTSAFETKLLTEDSKGRHSQRHNSMLSKLQI